MRYLGIDYGEKRVGLAYGDELGLATPLPAANESRKVERLAHIASLVQERRIDAVVIGYPLNMDGSVGFKAREVDDFIGELSKRVSIPIHKLDERLTSQQAAADMRSAGKKFSHNPRERKAQRASGELDSRAAAIILQDFLDAQSPDSGLLPPED